MFTSSFGSGPGSGSKTSSYGSGKKFQILTDSDPHNWYRQGKPTNSLPKFLYCIKIKIYEAYCKTCKKNALIKKYRIVISCHTATVHQFHTNTTPCLFEYGSSYMKRIRLRRNTVHNKKISCITNFLCYGSGSTQMIRLRKTV
jgi:hypothetical protein